MIKQFLTSTLGPLG
jgi:hypothetical protein